MVNAGSCGATYFKPRLQITSLFTIQKCGLWIRKLIVSGHIYSPPDGFDYWNQNMEDLNFIDYFAVFRRWKKIFLATTLVLLTLTLTFAIGWSDYRSTAVVQIVQPEISANATTPAGTNPQDMIE
jgi:hypothetical protein